MSEINQFLVPPDLTEPGNYELAAVVPYGTPILFNWTANYNIPLTLKIVQETHFLDGNTLPVNESILACTVPSLDLPVN